MTAIFDLLQYGLSSIRRVKHRYNSRNHVRSHMKRILESLQPIHRSPNSFLASHKIHNRYWIVSTYFEVLVVCYVCKGIQGVATTLIHKIRLQKSVQA